MPWKPGDAALYLDGEVTLAGHGQAAGQAVDLPDPVIVGDVAVLAGHAAGGPDTLQSSAFPEVTLIGDAGLIAAQAEGGDDLIVLLGNYSTTGTVGDAILLDGHAQGGADSIIGSGLSLIVSGDGMALAGHARGGDDLIDLTVRGTTVFGDAERLDDFAVGGNDTITINARSHQIYGDGGLAGHARGGDDLIDLRGSLPFGVVAGDGPYLRDRSQGGDDTLIGTANGNEFWGDAPEVGPDARRGHDLFVVTTYGGADVIGDFVSGEDHIRLASVEPTYHSLADLVISETERGLVITFEHENGKTLTLLGVSAIAEGDVLFG